MNPGDADTATGLHPTGLSEAAKMYLPGSRMVTVAIRHEPLTDAHAKYEGWLNRIIPVAARFPGHRGVSVIRPAPGAGVYTVILRFDRQRHADDWFRSESRRRLLAEVEPLLLRPEKMDTVTGLEFWFAPDAAPQKQARRYKQFLVTLSVIAPMSLFVPWALTPLFHALQPWGMNGLLEHLLGTAAVVGLVTYVVMPRYVKLVSGWLYR